MIFKVLSIKFILKILKFAFLLTVLVEVSSKHHPPGRFTRGEERRYSIHTVWLCPVITLHTIENAILTSTSTILPPCHRTDRAIAATFASNVQRKFLFFASRGVTFILEQTASCLFCVSSHVMSCHVCGDGEFVLSEEKIQLYLLCTHWRCFLKNSWSRLGLCLHLLYGRGDHQVAVSCIQILMTEWQARAASLCNIDFQVAGAT
jgi:hypothetical protein